MTLDDWLRETSGHIDRRDAQVIAAHVLGLTRAQLITQGPREVSQNEHTLMRNALIDRINLRPTAYITGSKEFYGLEFEVSDAVLVPRPETELLVERALEFLKGRPQAKVLDMGTGSGCIAISIAHHAPHVSVTAIDASSDALVVAKRNNEQHTQGRVLLLHSDWFSALGNERFDLIVSNPPYIAVGDPHLAALTHEPMMALTSGSDGLSAIGQIITQAPQHLSAQGELWLEHGYDQAAQVQALLTEKGFLQARSQKDLAQIDRITGGVWEA